MTHEDIKNHADFLADFAEHCVYFSTGDSHKAEQAHDFVEWFANETMKHAVKHCAETSPAQQNSTTSSRADSNPYPDMSKRMEECLSALRAIRTWATYEDGIELVPDDVISLIDRTLGGVETEKTHEWKSDKGWVSKDGKRVFEDG